MEEKKVEIVRQARIVVYNPGELFDRAVVKLEVSAKVAAVPDAPDVWLISERDATFDLSSDPEAAAAKIKILSDEAEAELNGQIADYVALMTKIVAALKENGYSVSFECR
jgi:hypothetical protein